MPGPWTDERRAKQAATIAARKQNAEFRKDRLARKGMINETAIKTVSHETVSLPSEVSKPTKSVQVTYRPYDGDPHSVKWNGVLFRANVPVTLDRANREHHIEQLLPKQYPGTNGETLTKHVPALVFMGDMARTNPSFEVDGERARRKINTRVVPAPGQEWSEAHEGQISESYERDDSIAA
jgi:hypothetical protein